PCVNGAFEPEGEFGADPDCLAGFVEKVVGYVSVADDGEAPVVEGDQLGEDLGAQLPAVAGDGVDPQLHAGGHRGVRGGTGRMLAVRVAQHQPWACCSSSGPKTVMAMRISLMTPSGWWQAPRPSTWPSQRRRVLRSDVRPSVSRWSSPAIASRPNRHGPHWPADSSAR